MIIDPFSLLKKAREEKTAGTAMQREKKLEDLASAYDAFVMTSPNPPFDVESRYNDAVIMLSDVKYTKGELSKYCRTLRPLNKKATVGSEALEALIDLRGIFLSAAINKVIDDDGERLSLNLTKAGLIGNYLGMRQDRGSVDIKGKAGSMLGYCRTGGDLHFDGSAGKETGRGMTDGRMFISGKIGSLSIYMDGGEIYNTGRKAWPDDDL